MGQGHIRPAEIAMRPLASSRTEASFTMRAKKGDNTITVLGKPTLWVIAQELLKTARTNVRKF